MLSNTIRNTINTFSKKKYNLIKQQQQIKTFVNQTTTETNLIQPLKGITVVALEQAVAAPFSTSRLADAGARVIKIERNDEILYKCTKSIQVYIQMYKAAWGTSLGAQSYMLT